MTRYQIKKAAARNEAISFQIDAASRVYSWEELANIAAYFVKIARRYGLVHEFTENGVI